MSTMIHGETAQIPAQAQATVEALRALALGGRDEIELLDGFTDTELDGWAIDVPEAVRVVLRAVGGVSGDDLHLEFGPRGPAARRSPFADGYWTLGEPEEESGSLIVGVDGAGRADWGPVITLDLADDPRLTVEAASFTGWLAALAERLAADPAGRDPAPAARVPAVPTVEVAEGPDTELAALVGRGDSLTDLVDLRALPGTPCEVEWRPYYSTHDTADTGSSEILLRMAGGGRALLVTSDVMGDFLDRPVRRHRVPADAAARAVAELRELAAELPGRLTLEPGRGDAEMDGWPVPVPEDVRTVLRAIGGVSVTGMPDLRLLPGAAEHAIDPEAHRMMGGDGSYWPVSRVRYGRYSALAQVRIDRRTGEWGYVVSVPDDPRGLGERPEVTPLAESLPHLLLTVTRIVRAAAAEPDFARHVADRTGWFFPNTGEPWPRPVPVAEWADEADPLRASVAALAPGALAVDLRDAPIPADLRFTEARQWSYRTRLDHLDFPGAGRLAIAIPVAG